MIMFPPLPLPLPLPPASTRGPFGRPCETIKTIARLRANSFVSELRLRCFILVVDLVDSSWFDGIVLGWSLFRTGRQLSNSRVLSLFLLQLLTFG